MIIRNARFAISCIFLSGFLFFTACQKESSGQPIVPPNAAVPVASQTVNGSLLPLVPTAQDRSVARLFTRVLGAQHISQRPLDKAVSKEAFRLYLKGLDPFKLYFYQSDIDSFAKYEDQICDLAKQGNVSPAFEIYNTYLDRVKERVDMVMQILDTPQDFTIDEEIIRKKELLAWPNSKEEAYDRWRKRVKDDILALKAEAKEKAKDREKAIADGKTPKALDERDPIERLKKRYASFRKRMLLENHIEQGKILDDIKKAANDDVMEAYLSSISGALDPHTSYMSPTTLENFNINMEKKLEGIGATLTSEDGYTVVKKLVPGGPADKGGQLKVDDKISGVGQGREGKIEDVVDARLSDVVKMIRGDKGTTVRLEVIPSDGSATKVIEIVREQVDLKDQAAKGEVFDFGSRPDNGQPYKIGVIDLPDFYLDMRGFRQDDPNARSTTNDVKKILKDFVSKNVDVVVLDLKRNGGGSLYEAVALTGLFIETGNVVQTKDDVNRPQQRDDPDPGCDWTGPLVVIESKFSASASEIFAGAIKDYQRGLLVGDSRTHGKGTVQQMKDLSEIFMNGSPTNLELGVIKLTIQGFYRPSGVSPQREGVAADVVIPSLTDVLEDICESDLDNALTLNKITQARNFPPKFPYVSSQISATLQELSDKRVVGNEEFAKLQKEIAIYKEIKGRKTSTLNEKKYFEELDRLNADKKERESFEDLVDSDSKIKRDYYLDEVLAISIDYVNVLKGFGVSFPVAKTVTPKPSPLSLFFGK